MNRLLLFLLGIAPALSACEYVTTGQAAVQTDSGYAQGIADVRITENWFRDNVSIQVALQNGEFFTGSAVIEKSTRNFTRDIVVEVEDPETGILEPEVRRLDASEDIYASTAQAVLIGTDGRTMECDFTLNRPADGFNAGGIGECLLSTGEKMPILF